MATIRTVTLGCKVNQYETEYVRQSLVGAGYRDATEGEPAGPLKGVTTAQPGSGIRVPLLRQAWPRVTFVHWRYPGPLLQRLMPSGLTGVAAPFQGLVLRRR